MLGGDNAVVIALASRRLAPQQRNKAIFWGVFGAIALRVVLIFFALYLLAIPFLKVVGAVLLLWIGVKLLLPEPGGEEHQIDAKTNLIGAIKTIIVADAVMSLDNVIAIAGAAKGNIGLVIFGLVVSVPIIVWGSKLVIKLMSRFPIVIVLGGALLGWIAGDMTASDVAWSGWFTANVPAAGLVTPALGAILVVVMGRLIGARQLSARGRVSTDLAASGAPASGPSDNKDASGGMR